MCRCLTFQEIEPFYKDYPVFVETGTCFGKTVFSMKDRFLQLHTVEIDEAKFKTTVEVAKKANITNVSFVLGDSVDFLNYLVGTLIFPTIFFLDAHKCCSDKTPIPDVPVIDEVKVIAKKFLLRAVLIIDDVNHFGVVKNGLDWKKVTETTLLAAAGKKRVETSYVKKDRFYIFLRAIK